MCTLYAGLWHPFETNASALTRPGIPVTISMAARTLSPGASVSMGAVPLAASCLGCPAAASAAAAGSPAADVPAPLSPPPTAAFASPAVPVVPSAVALASFSAACLPSCVVRSALRFWSFSVRSLSLPWSRKRNVRFATGSDLVVQSDSAACCLLRMVQAQVLCQTQLPAMHSGQRTAGNMRSASAFKPQRPIRLLWRW